MIAYMNRMAYRISCGISKYLWKPILIAGFFVLVALLWTFLLQHVIAYPFVFLFFGAIMGSAWFGGILAGIWSIVFSSILVTFFFIPPLYSFTIDRELRSYDAAFILCAIAITAISAARRRIETTARAARDELEERVRARTAELEQTNREILERERQLRLLTEAIPQQIWRANADGVIEYCNRDLLEFTGLSRGDLRGEGFFRIFHPLDEPLFRQSWNDARLASSRFEVQVRVRSAARGHRWFLVRGIPQRTASGEIDCWYGVHIDIEEQYQAEEALRAAQDDSARWARTLSMAEMAASIAHEIKQPLTALVAQAQACKRWLRAQPANTEKATNAAENLVRESMRASAVIDHVRSLFSEKEPLREATNFNRIIREALPLLRDEAVRRGVSIHLELEENLPPIEADAVQIRQLLINLAINGMDAMMEINGERMLTLRTESAGAAGAMLTVGDAGSGMSEEIRAKIFEPFFTTKSHGTGIGLSICRSIVEAHDGHIWAENLTPGTAFHVVLGSKA
jgi:PAS domain S-box-containing protein